MHDDKPQELGGGDGGGNEERLDGEAEDHEQYMQRKGQAEALRSEGRLVGGVCEGASEGVHRQVRSPYPRLAKAAVRHSKSGVAQRSHRSGGGARRQRHRQRPSCTNVASCEQTAFGCNRLARLRSHAGRMIIAQTFVS